MTTRNNINAWELSLYIFAVLTVLSLMAIIVLFQFPGCGKAAYYAIYAMQVSILMLILSISKVK